MRQADTRLTAFTTRHEEVYHRTLARRSVKRRQQSTQQGDGKAQARIVVHGQTVGAANG